MSITPGVWSVEWRFKSPKHSSWCMGSYILNQDSITLNHVGGFSPILKYMSSSMGRMTSQQYMEKWKSCSKTTNQYSKSCCILTTTGHKLFVAPRRGSRRRERPPEKRFCSSRKPWSGRRQPPRGTTIGPWGKCIKTMWVHGKSPY